MTTTINDINWTEVKSRVKREITGIRPAEYGELCDAIEETHDVSALTSGGLVESAEESGVLKSKNDGYVFNPRGDEEPEDKEPIDASEPSDVDLGEVIESDQTLYPEYMRTRGQWVCWAGNKQPRAPWRGHVYPVLWNGSLDESEMPTVSYEQASKWVDMVGDLHLDYPEGISPSDVELGYLLPHTDGHLVLIDLDDVRDPETGELHPVALDILQMAGSYAEMSQSGEGVHIFIIGTLPDGVGRVIEPIDDEPYIGDDIPKVEVYDHGRVVAMTGDHVDGTPSKVASNQPVVDDIVDEYLDLDETTVDNLIKSELVEGERSSGSGKKRSPYYEQSPENLIDTSGKEWSSNGRYLNGPHPVHGDSDNSNFVVDADTWHCFSHEASGGPLTLIGMLEGVLCCGEDLDSVSDDEFTRICLIARDRYKFSGEWKPPYRALLAVARKLYLVDEDDDTIGGMYGVARNAYESMDVGDL